MYSWSTWLSTPVDDPSVGQIWLNASSHSALFEPIRIGRRWEQGREGDNPAASLVWLFAFRRFAAMGLDEGGKIFRQVPLSRAACLLQLAMRPAEGVDLQVGEAVPPLVAGLQQIDIDLAGNSLASKGSTAMSCKSAAVKTSSVCLQSLQLGHGSNRRARGRSPAKVPLRSNGPQRGLGTRLKAAFHRTKFLMVRTPTSETP